MNLEGIVLAITGRPSADGSFAGLDSIGGTIPLDQLLMRFPRERVVAAIESGATGVALGQWAHRHGVKVIEGVSLTERLVHAVAGNAHLIRIPADRPFLFPEVVEWLLAERVRHEAELVHVPTAHFGLVPDLVSRAALESLDPTIERPIEALLHDAPMMRSVTLDPGESLLIPEGWNVSFSLAENSNREFLANLVAKPPTSLAVALSTAAEWRADACRDRTRANIGCGNDPRDGYVNCDLYNLRHADIRCDMTAIDRFFPPDSLDEILSIASFEHLGFRHEIPRLLSAARCILRSGGRLVLETSDLYEICRMYVDWVDAGLRFDDSARKRWPNLLDETSNDQALQHFFPVYFYGTQRVPGQFHLNGYSPGHLERLLLDAGFSRVEHEPSHFDSSRWCPMQRAIAIK